MNEKIEFIITGGTIDSYYDGTKDTVEVNDLSVIPKYINGLKIPYPVIFSEVCMKDSRKISAEDREKILKQIKDSSSTKIIITHGTYTLPDTARFLKVNLGKIDKTIILTGSFVPLVGFAPSDAGFNLGFAVAKLQDLAPGI